MAAVPKNKRSKSKRDMKRNSYKLTVLNIVECPRCRAKKIAHRVCLSCGYYDNNEIIKFKEKSKEKQKEKATTKTKSKTRKQIGKISGEEKVNETSKVEKQKIEKQDEKIAKEAI